ncbi:MAG: DUF5996 family protein [Thermoanaerobaculia bacterium]
MAAAPTSSDPAWPPLPFEEWKDTCATLHMYTQIVGKVRLALSPPVNHWWHVPLYVTARGLTTSPIPYRGEIFEIEFDFLSHRLELRTGSGGGGAVALQPRPVADFYGRTMALLRSQGIEVAIRPMPVEVPDPIPFDQDQQHASYDREQAHRFWRLLVLADTIFKEFRGRFLGKCSPVHFFWGSFDLAATRFSGRRAPPREGTDSITREAYSHEVSSAGFWPGGGGIDGPAFYCYAAPEPPGLSAEPIRPEAAFYHPALKEFLLPYGAVRTEASLRAAVMDFLQSSYEACARLAGWDLESLERRLESRAG